MVSTHQDLNFDEGDDFPYTITVVDSDGSAVDLTGYTFYMTIKYKKSDSDTQAIFKKTVTVIPDPELGIVTITIDRADTLGIIPGTYPYDIKYKDDSGDVRTLLRGQYKLIQGVTDSVA